MNKRLDLRLLSILCVVVLVFLALSTSVFSGKVEKVEKWIGVEGGSITLEDHVTITFKKNILIFIFPFLNSILDTIYSILSFYWHTFYWLICILYYLLYNISGGWYKGV